MNVRRALARATRTMKIAVCIAPSSVDHYGYLPRYAAQLAAAAQARGIAVEILQFPKDDFFARLFTNLADENCIVYFYGYLYDLRLVTSVAKGGIIHALENSRATTIATVGDHPFSPFMQAAIGHAHPSTRFIVMDKTFPDEMRALNPALKDSRYAYRPIAPAATYEANLATNFDDRHFDLVVPMFVTDMSENGIDFILSSVHTDWFKRTIEATYAQSLVEYQKSPFHIFTECLQAEIGTITFDDIRGQNPKFVREILTTLAAVDGLVRQDRRQQMIASLLKTVGGLKVAVTCDPIPALKVDERVEFLGKRPVSDVVGLMSNTRAVLNCNPSYPSSLHERVVSGMLYESCVITDINSYIDRNFSAKELVPYAPDESKTLPDIFETCDVAAIAAAGRTRIKGDPAYSWNAHIDGLLQAAA